jgi:hypothetical protein
LLLQVFLLWKSAASGILYLGDSHSGSYAFSNEFYKQLGDQNLHYYAAGASNTMGWVDPPGWNARRVICKHRYKTKSGTRVYSKNVAYRLPGQPRFSRGNGKDLAQIRKICKGKGPLLGNLISEHDPDHVVINLGENSMSLQSSLAKRLKKISGILKGKKCTWILPVPHNNELARYKGYKGKLFHINEERRKTARVIKKALGNRCQIIDPFDRENGIVDNMNSACEQKSRCLRWSKRGHNRRRTCLQWKRGGTYSDHRDKIHHRSCGYRGFAESVAQMIRGQASNIYKGNSNYTGGEIPKTAYNDNLYALFNSGEKTEQEVDCPKKAITEAAPYKSVENTLSYAQGAICGKNRSSIDRPILTGSGKVSISASYFNVRSAPHCFTNDPSCRNLTGCFLGRKLMGELGKKGNQEVEIDLTRTYCGAYRLKAPFQCYSSRQGKVITVGKEGGKGFYIFPNPRYVKMISN